MESKEDQAEVVDLKLSVVKLLEAQWLIELYDYYAAKTTVYCTCRWISWSWHPVICYCLEYYISNIDE